MLTVSHCLCQIIGFRVLIFIFQRNPFQETTSEIKQTSVFKNPSIRSILLRFSAAIKCLAMVLNGVKAVFFDLDNTLIDTAGANKIAIQKVIQLLKSKYQYSDDEASILCEKYQSKLLNESFDPSTVNIDKHRVLHWEEAIQETQPSEACKHMAAECYDLWKSTRLQHVTLGEDTRHMLTELRKRARLLLLTNGEKHVQWEKIDACACQPYFDAIVVGGEHKEEKPSPSIFHHCCHLLGVKPDECVMVGDNLDTDIQGGLNAGLKATVWISNAAHVGRKDNLHPAPDFIIPSVLDLPTILTEV